MNTLLKIGLLAWKYAVRHKTRSILTIIGVACGMFLFTAIETTQKSLKVMTETNANDTTLVVYRENRYCPMTSRLPEHYLPDIRKIEGVREVIPIQIVVNNCGASLDVITYRGVPSDSLNKYNPDLKLLDGSYEDWANRSDAALIGYHFAAGRGLKVGDQFEAVGIKTHVAGIIESPHAQDNNVAYVHLPFLQQSSRVGLGTVTQFNVRVDSPEQLDIVSSEIDAIFKSDSAPTVTKPEKAFFAQTAKDLIELITFTRWMGIGSVLAVIALITNALMLIARSRRKESAILQTIGFSQANIAVLMTCEGMFLGMIGGVIGTMSATIFFSIKRFTFGNEGLTMAISANANVTITSIVVAILLGLFASLWPAYVSSRKPIVSSLRNS